MTIGRIVVRCMLVVLVGGLIYGFLRIPDVIGLFRYQKSINVLAWPNIIDAQYFDVFEQESGIKVYLTYFENYEELLVKMQAGSGDYDLIMASDYAVSTLIQADIVKPLDKSKIAFWSQLYPSILGLYFDPDNSYTVPFSWEIFGLGIDTTFFKDTLPQASWSLLFDEKIAPKRVGMLDDAREIVSVAALYLKKKRKLTKEDMR